MENKETLEKIAENESEYLADWEDKVMYKKGFIEGANYQAERMYSEEDLNEMFDTLKRNSIDNILFIDSWKRQFKKK